MTIAYKVFGDDNFGSVRYGDNFKSFEEAEEYIKSHDWKGNLGLEDGCRIDTEA